MRSYEERGRQLGALVDAKSRAYGDSAGRSGAILRVLYPEGIPPHAYDDVMLLVRSIDKMSRIAQRGPDRRDLGGESPWQDLAGYGLLGALMDEQQATSAAPAVASGTGGELARLWGFVAYVCRVAGLEEPADVAALQRMIDEDELCHRPPEGP